jgi:hypothetical protein
MMEAEELVRDLVDLLVYKYRVPDDEVAEILSLASIWLDGQRNKRARSDSRKLRVIDGGRR